MQQETKKKLLPGKRMPLAAAWKSAALQEPKAMAAALRDVAGNAVIVNFTFHFLRKGVPPELLFTYSLRPKIT